MSNRVSQIKNIINNYNDIFDSSVVTNLNNLIKIDGEEIYFPYIPQYSPELGLKLKDDVGVITIQETYKNNSVVSYIYRFTSLKYEYIFYRCKSNDNCLGLYSFHYDLEENDDHHPPHVTSMLPSIRHYSKKIDLEDFLNFIQSNFYCNLQGITTCKMGNIWDNRFI